MYDLRIIGGMVAVVAGMALAGCGGGSASAPPVDIPVPPPPKMASISGTIVGVSAGITFLLLNNGTNITNVNTGAADTSFTFGKTLAANAAYNVSLYTQPSGVYCKLENAVGTVNAQADDVKNVAIRCELGFIGFSNYNVGVTVSGLAVGNTVSFLNNGDDVLSVKENGLSVFARTYAEQEVPALGTFNVTVSTQPSGQTCTLTNSSGDVSKLHINFANVLVSCK